MPLAFEAQVWQWRGPAPFFFVTVPAEASQSIQAAARLITYGWGMIPVSVQIGQTRWSTSLFPKDALYALPLKDAVRKAESIKEGDVVNVQLDIDFKPRCR